MRLSLCILSLLMLLCSCGYTDAGSGTGGLWVEATAVHDPVAENITELRIQVRDANGPLDHADVQIENDETHTRHALPGMGAGTYTLTLPGYTQRVALFVEHGRERLFGQLEGPSPHLVSTPKQGARLRLGRLGLGVHIGWETLDGIRSDSVQIGAATGMYDADINSGTFTLPAEALDLGTTEIVVERQNRVNLRGGANGSSLTITYRIPVTVTIEP